MTTRNRAMTLAAGAAAALTLTACNGGAPSVSVPTSTTSSSSSTSTTSSTSSTSSSSSSTETSSSSTETSSSSSSGGTQTYKSSFASLADQQGWSNGSDAKKGTLGFAGGTYNASIKPHGTWIVSHDKFRYENTDDVAMTFDTAGMTGNPFVGLICFADINNNNVDSFYDITVRPNGAVALYRFDKDKKGVKIAGGAATGFNASGAHLEFACKKEGGTVHFTAVVNGQQVIDAKDPSSTPLAPGKFRMEMLSENDAAASVKFRTIDATWNSVSTSADGT